MQNKTLLRVALGLASTGTLILAGCAAGDSGSKVPAPTPASVVLQGRVVGGQQPVSGATIQLYAANQTGYGVAATPLIAATVTTNAGAFSITGDYTCPYASSQVYITATGGNPGLGTNNPNLALMAALGSCGNLSSASYININELTTVASAYALSPFMSSSTQLSTTPTNVTGLSNAFATVNKLVNITNGLMPGTTLPAGATEPTALLNTLADIVASCINSGGGTTGDGSFCGSLFLDATPAGGTAPTDTITAILNVAKTPANNAAALFGLALPGAPFQPTLPAAPAAYTVSLRYAPTGSGAFSTPSASALDSAGNVWVTNSGNNTISVINATTGLPTAYSGGGLNAPSAIAFDSNGNAWVPNKTSSTLSVFTPSGAGTTALTANLSAPAGVAIDAQGLIWVTNSGNNTVTSVSASGVSVTGSTKYAVSGTGPAAIAINTH